MSTMDNMAFLEKYSVFRGLDSMAEYAKLNEAERMAYDAELKAYRDLRGQLEYSQEEGLKQGRAEGRAEIVRNMALIGVDLNTIAKGAGMTIEEVKQIISQG